jgi:hypothetical protein
VGHLSKLQDEYGKKGLTIIAITGEDKDMNLRYMVHNDPGFRYKVAIGGASGYEMPGVPFAFLIDAEGKIVYRGSPGGLSKKKVLLPALKQVREPTEEEVAARSQKMLDFAEAFVADKMYLRAELAFDKLIAKFPKSEAAATAKERKKAMLDEDGAKAEHDAQKKIAKLVGGVEAPDGSSKKMKSKQIESAVKKLKKLAEGFEETAPRSAELAQEWRNIFRIKWQ